MGRTFAIGDIHGSLTALTTLLDGIKLTKDDTLIFLGDYVNRGENSKGVLDVLMNLPNICQSIFIMGNHELIMLCGLKHKDDFEFWLKVGGDKTLESFNLFPRRSECMHLPFDYVNFLNKTQDYFENEHFIFCHASIYSHLPLDKQDDYALRWRKLESDHLPHISGKTIICGHTEQRNGQVLFQNGIICIDTWAYGDGCLTALQIDNDKPIKLYQANHQGKLFITSFDDEN